MMHLTSTGKPRGPLGRLATAARAWIPADPAPHPRRSTWRDEGIPGWIQFGGVVLQLALVVSVAHWLGLESERGFTPRTGDWLAWIDPVGSGLLALLAAAFLVQAFLPLRWRVPFFLAVSFAAYFQIMGWADGGLLV